MTHFNAHLRFVSFVSNVSEGGKMAAVAEIMAIHPPATVQQKWLALALGLVTKLFFDKFCAAGVGNPVGRVLETSLLGRDRSVRFRLTASPFTVSKKRPLAGPLHNSTFLGEGARSPAPAAAIPASHHRAAHGGCCLASGAPAAPARQCGPEPATGLPGGRCGAPSHGYGS